MTFFSFGCKRFMTVRQCQCWIQPQYHTSPYSILLHSITHTLLNSNSQLTNQNRSLEYCPNIQQYQITKVIELRRFHSHLAEFRYSKYLMLFSFCRLRRHISIVWSRHGLTTSRKNKPWSYQIRLLYRRSIPKSYE